MLATSQLALPAPSTAFLPVLLDETSRYHCVQCATAAVDLTFKAVKQGLILGMTVSIITLDYYLTQVVGI